MSSHTAKRRTPMPEFEPFRALDAGRATLDQSTLIRSEARLAQIMSENPAASPVPLATRAPNRLWRWAAIPVAAAVAIGLGIALPGAPGAETAHATLATWRAEATPIPPDQLSSAAQRCRDKLDFAVADTFAGQEIGLDDDPVIAELRGDWGFLVFAQTTAGAGSALFPDSFWGVDEVAGCFVWFSTPTTPQPQFVQYTRRSPGGITTTSWSNDLVEVTGSHSGSFGASDVPASLRGTTPLVMEARFDGAAFIAVVSPVPDDVLALGINSSDAGAVRATISNGWYAAWWPTNAPDATTSFGVIRDDGSFEQIPLCRGANRYDAETGSCVQMKLDAHQPG